MDVTTVDPRDETWELREPHYRVYFHRDGASEEYELSGADVDEVIAWAEARREDRTFVLYTCVERDGLGLVRLRGRDPNAAP